MKRRVLPTRHGGKAVTAAAAFTGLLALSGCSFGGISSLPLPGGPDTGSNPYEVKVDFANVLDLVPQSTCKVNDVSVGKVTKIRLQGWHAQVVCKLRRDVKLPDNAVATIGQTSLLGEKYVALSAPTQEAPSGTLSQGDEIPLSRTTRTTEVEEVLSALSLLLNGGGIEQVSTITQELNAALHGREDTIKDVLRRVNTFVGTLDRQKADITRALDSIDRLSGKLAAEKKTIADTIDKTGPAVQVLKQNRADLTQMLVSLGRLGDVTTNVINKSRADLLANLKALEPLLINLNRAGANLPKGLELLLSYPFPPTYTNTQVGDYANIHMTIDLDLKNLAHNLLGGTALDGQLAKQGDQLRSQLKPPQIIIPQSPLGVLPAGLTSATGQSGGSTGGTGGTNTGGALPPAGSAEPGVQTLITGGLS
ncbi:MCE family protein [Actinomadura scrupuli]|uniref:MCE family protein n=1 Tax=Actinomadura scrupuli TaxID=559629 RepID=UPI003D99728B